MTKREEILDPESDPKREKIQDSKGESNSQDKEEDKVEPNFQDEENDANSDPILGGLSPFQLAILGEIESEINEKGINSFDELREGLKEDVIRNLNWRLYRAIKLKFPNFALPPNLPIQKVKNAKEVESATHDAWITKASNGIPTEFVFWDIRTGKLVKHRAKIGEDNVWIEMNEEEFISGPNRNNFEIFQDPITAKYQVLDKITKRIFDPEDYIKDQSGQVNDFLHMMRPPYIEPIPIPPKLEVYFDPKSRKHFIPSDLYWKTDIEKTLISWFQYNPQLIDTNIVKEEIKTIWQALSPEQRWDFLADFSFPLFNIINETARLEDGKIYILSYGTTDAGKTFLHRLAMRFFWGFDQYFKGEWIDSKFRLEVILSATNLPIFIDEVSKMSEAAIQDIKASTGGGVSGRGQGNLDVRIYHSRTTLVMSSQHNVFADFNITDERALTRRFSINYYGEKIIPNNKTRHLLENLKTRGYAIHILQNRTIDELADLYRQITEEVNDNRILATLIWGARILNLTPDQLKETRYNIAEDERESSTHLFYNIWEKIEEAKGDPTKHLDSLTSQLFGNIIKIEKKDSTPYLAINTTFLKIVNSSNYPLRGKFKTLSELNELEKYFDKDVIKKLPEGRIFANYPIWFGKKLYKAACIPYTYEEREKAKALNLPEALYKTYKKLFYPQEQDQQAEEPQPQQEQQQSQEQNNQQQQEQPQQEHQQDQQPQPQEQDTNEFIEREKEIERKREELIEDFGNNNNTLELGAHFEMISDEDKKAILEAMYRNGEIMPIPGTGKWKYRLGG